MAKSLAPLLVLSLFGLLLFYSNPERDEATAIQAAAVPDAAPDSPERKVASKVESENGTKKEGTPKRSKPPEPENRPPDVPDDRPLPASRRTGKDLFSRTLGEHFRSHPDTTQRILHLRQLGAAARNEPPTDPTDSGTSSSPSPDLLDLAVDFKNQGSRVVTELFGEAVGPLSVDEEWSLGAKTHSQLLETMDVDQAESDRIAKLAAPLLSYLKRTQGRAYTFTVVRNEQVNAFAHHGGHVYVNSGLLQLLKQDHELLFVLGHEVGHVERGHCAKAAQSIDVANRTLGSMATLPATVLYKVVSLSYSEFDEHDADAWSYKTLRKMGITERDIVFFFYTLMEYEASVREKSAS